MVLPRKSSKLAAALLIWAAPAGAQITAGDMFDAQITALTRDWTAEDWDDGAIRIHPDRYNEFADDFHLTIYAPEPAEGRSITDVARVHFDGYEMDDDTLETTIVNMDGAEEISEGVVARPYAWAHAFDDYISLFGAVGRPDGMVIPYHSTCARDRPDRPDREAYGEDACLKAISMILTALSGRAGTVLAPPEPPTPISAPGWRSSYDASGTTVLSRSNFHGTVNATVMVGPAISIPAAQLQGQIASFAGSLVDEFDDQTGEDPGTTEWVGSAQDPWLRRIFPEAFSGPSTIMGARRRHRVAGRH